MVENGEVLFVREENQENGDSHSDIWDDTALLEAYDKAVNLAKEDVIKSIGLDSSDTEKRSKKNKNGKKKKQVSEPMEEKKWLVGSPCRAIYHGDELLYEAIITKIFKNEGTCIVKFIGYNNIEKVKLIDLLESNGSQDQIQQQKAAYEENYAENNANSSFTSQFNNGVPACPPLPPSLLAKLPESNADALSSMLMSWYISGFHTGYYYGMKHSKN